MGQTDRSVSTALLDAACEVERLEAECERLQAQVQRLTQLGRKAYRRGYLAGRAAARRGAPHDGEPERRARGELGELLR